MIFRSAHLTVTWLLLSASLVLVLGPCSAYAASRFIASDQLGKEPPRLAVGPDSYEPQVINPGDEITFKAQVTNYTQQTFTLSADTVGLVGSRDSDSLVDVGTSDRSTAAQEWVQLPFQTVEQFRSGEQLPVVIRITVPHDASPGVYAFAVKFSRVLKPQGNNENQGGANIEATASAATRIIFTVAGDARSEARIREIDAPRFIRSSNTPRFRARVENVGDTLLDLDGETRLSPLGWLARRSLTTNNQLVLPGGVRQLTFTWNDPPLAGWYTPTLIVVGGEGSGVRIERKLDRVWVIPPWWLVVTTVIAIWLPIRSARRRDSYED